MSQSFNVVTIDGVAPLVSMTSEQYGRFQTAMGEAVVQAGDRLWRRVRPLFYRPLLPFEEISDESPARPMLACFGGVQYVTGENVLDNSMMHFIISKPSASYSPTNLDYNRRRQLSMASKKFKIRQVTDPLEFRQQAYLIYLDFYGRTRYAYKSGRRDPDRFSSWVGTVFRFPQVLVLGAYEGAELRAVSLSQYVERTVLYSTFFSTSDSLKQYVSDLMLHSVREIASRDKRVEQVYAGMWKGGGGMDNFYLLRGFAKISKPVSYTHLTLPTIYSV